MKVTVAMLREVAKGYGIEGRWDMTKAQLEAAIKECEDKSGHEDLVAEDEFCQREIETQDEELKAVLAETEETESPFEKMAKEQADDEWDEVLEIPKEWGPIAAKPKTAYIDRLEPGTMIAFKLRPDKMISGIVSSVTRDISSKGIVEVQVQTKNGQVHKIVEEAISWVKTGSRWPRGVYLALRGDISGIR